jgi:hypothetical protein
VREADEGFGEEGGGRRDGSGVERRGVGIITEGGGMAGSVDDGREPGEGVVEDRWIGRGVFL